MTTVSERRIKERRRTAGTTGSVPNRPTADELSARALERRAIEAINWGMPAVNYELMYQAMVRGAKGAYNQIAYWSRLPDWKIQTLTPNPDVIYLKPFFNTKESGRWCSRFRRPTVALSPARSWTRGRQPWKMSVRLGWILARAEST